MYTRTVNNTMQVQAKLCPLPDSSLKKIKCENYINTLKFLLS